MAEYPLDAAKSIKHTKENKKTAADLPTGRTAKGVRANFNKLMRGPGEAADKSSALRDIKAGRYSTEPKTSSFKKLMDKPGWDK